MHSLTETEQIDFWKRVLIFDQSPRIDDVPRLVKDRHMRTVKRESRDSVYQRLEGWWHDASVALLIGKRTQAIFGFEVSEKLSANAPKSITYLCTSIEPPKLIGERRWNATAADAVVVCSALRGVKRRLASKINRNGSLARETRYHLVLPDIGRCLSNDIAVFTGAEAFGLHAGEGCAEAFHVLAEKLW